MSEERIAALENHVRGLVTAFDQLAGIVRILDQYMLLNKRFFDQVQLNETKPTPVVTPEIVEAVRAEEKK